MKVTKLKIPDKPKLRNYESYIYDMTRFAKDNAERLFKDTEYYPIRILYDFAKRSGAAVYNLKPIKKNRRKICNSIMRKDISDAKISYSKSVSSGKYDTGEEPNEKGNT